MASHTCAFPARALVALLALPHAASTSAGHFVRRIMAQGCVRVQWLQQVTAPALSHNSFHNQVEASNLQSLSPAASPTFATTVAVAALPPIC